MTAALPGTEPFAPTKTTFTHPELGSITGWKRGNDIVQFRGIPYASIPARFRQSQLRTSLPEQPFDATNPGPTCPHPQLDYWKYWNAELPVELPKLNSVVTDELQCLNLSMTIPSRVLRGEKTNVPIFVFIHGGAFLGGSHAIQLCGREVFDSAGLVRRSMSLDKDLIAIGINYRVGPLGFLASRELTAFNKQHGEPAGNYGLHDQRQALEWIHKFISGFEGDPERVTIQGTSAGGASCHLQTLFPDRKFKRAILASGTCWGITPVTQDVAQREFDRLHAKVKSDDDQNPLDVLSNLDTNTLNTAVPFHVFHPLIDDVWVSKDVVLPPDHEHMPLADIMVGAALREDEVVEMVVRDKTTGQLRSDKEAYGFMRNTFNNNHCIQSPEHFPFENPSFAKAYGVVNLNDCDLNDPKLNLDENFAAWNFLVGHVLFNFPTYLLAQVLRQAKEKSNIWLYHYEATNPYPASHSPNWAHHGVNDILLFNVGPDQIPTEHLDAWIGAVEQTQRSWIEFVNNESPWRAVRKEGKLGPVFVFRNGQGSREYETLEQGLDPELARCWTAMKPSFRYQS